MAAAYIQGCSIHIRAAVLAPTAGCGGSAWVRHGRCVPTRGSDVFIHLGINKDDIVEVSGTATTARQPGLAICNGVAKRAWAAG